MIMYAYDGKIFKCILKSEDCAQLVSDFDNIKQGLNKCWWHQETVDIMYRVMCNNAHKLNDNLAGSLYGMMKRN